ncbi:MAG: DUF1822 family protein [Lyngbya sp.]|nr:DUF1822 family protein [Lyngbya sp.]
MESFSRNPENIIFEFGLLPTEAVALNPEYIDRAIHISNQVVGESQQWNTYLNALALFGFEEWLNQNYPELTVNRDQCSLFQPYLAHLFQAVFHLKVGQFKICLLRIRSLGQTVDLPQLALELSPFIAHFYVITNVIEEDGYVQISGFLNYDRLVKQLQLTPLKSNLEWCYSLPLNWFERDVSKLLLHLSCLDATAIHLPNRVSDSPPNFTQIKTKLSQALLQFQPDKTHLWEVLTWEQAKVIFSHPQLLDWLGQLQTQGRNDSSNFRLQELLQQLTQPTINFALWMRDELDEVAKSLSWTLLSPALVGNGLRGNSEYGFTELDTNFSPISNAQTQEIKTILTLNTFLQKAGVSVPSEACIGYQDFDLGGNSLRLYAITWLLNPSSLTPNWTLLLILGTPGEHDLPDAIQWSICDEEQVLNKPVKVSDSTHLYSEVIGEGDEKIWVTVTLSDGNTLTFPPFTYHLES